MNVDHAIVVAREGRVVHLVDADIAADEVVRAGGEGAVAVQARELVLGAPAVATEVPLLVVDDAATVAGLTAGVWCGPWTLATLIRRRRPRGVVLLDRRGHPAVRAILERHLELETVGELSGDRPPAGAAELSGEAVSAALEWAREHPLAAAPEEVAELLFDLALAGHLGEVWRVPFLVHVADHSRFKPPHVDEDEPIRAFHAAYDGFVSSLGMLESARYQLHGRQPRDLRELAEGVGMPVHELAWIFRRMDHTRVVVSTPVEEGLGDRPNLEIHGIAAPPDELGAAVDAVAALRVLRGALAVSPESPADGGEPQPVLSTGAGDALFSSLKDVPPLQVAAPAPAAVTPRPEPEAVPERAPEPIPDHLPGLDALARGDLRAARAALRAVEGEDRAEALLLASFRYDLVGSDGRSRRRYQLPAEIRDIALRALELERVPSARVREILDAEFPDAFAEMPQPGEIEVFYDGGPLAGTHRLRELAGRARFEEPLLEGRRAAQARVMAGQPVEDDLGDPGWDALNEALRLRDGDRAEEALAALDEVDLELDLTEIRTTVVRVLPEEHPDRVALERREAEEQERRALGAVLDGIERALREGRAGELEGYQSLEQAAENDLLDRLAAFLRRRSDDDPRDLGPALWLARVEARRGEFVHSQDAYRRAARMLAGRGRTVEWRFELVESALRGGGDAVAWDTIAELIADGATPREVDHHLERLFLSGVLSHRHHDALRELFGERKLRKLDRLSRRLQRQETMEPWKKALQGLKLKED